MMSHLHPGFDIHEVGTLDIPEDHPDEYTGAVEAFVAPHDPDTSAVELWAPTKNGQPVAICTLDADLLCAILLGVPDECADLADWEKTRQVAINMLSYLYNRYVGKKKIDPPPMIPEFEDADIANFLKEYGS